MSESAAELTRPIPPSIAAWRFCPACAAPLRAGQSAAHEQPWKHCDACGQRYWANPKPTVSVLAEDPDGRLLLVRRAVEPFRGMWDLPGGFMDEGEEPEATALRELAEETGLDASIDSLVSVHADTYGGTHASTVNVFYRVHVASPEGGAPADDVAELCWFAPGDLPARDELAFECVPAAIDDWRRLTA